MNKARALATSIEKPPQGLPNRIWAAIRSNGERHFLHKEPLEGMAAWAKGTNVTIVEYRFEAVVHAPPKPRKTGGR